MTTRAPAKDRPTSNGPPRHDALLYDSDHQFVDTAWGHLSEGDERGEQLMVACTGEHTRLILAAAPDHADIVAVENEDTNLSPAAAMEDYLQATRRAVASGATGLCVVGELPAGTNKYPHTWPGWSRYEAVVNQVFATLPFQALCAYDTRTTDPSLLTAVRATHPHTRHRAGRRVNSEYRNPTDLLRRWSDPAAAPVESSVPLLEITDIRTAADIHRARAGVVRVLVQLDTALLSYAALLPPADPTLVEMEEYLLAVTEVLNNALAHGSVPAVLRLWVDHDQVTATVTDGGDGFSNSLAGYTTGSNPRPYGSSTQSQLGLWIARQLCDELSYRHGPDGFTVRLRADLDVRAE